MTVVFLTKDVCLSGTISTLRFAAPGRLRALDIIEPENRHSQTPQGTYWLNMTLTSQESSHTGFTHHHIIDIAWSWSQNTPPLIHPIASQAQIGHPSHTGRRGRLPLRSLLWLRPLWELRIEWEGGGGPEEGGPQRKH